MDDMGDNGQVLPAITTTDIIIIDNEPRVTDVKLAAALGYAGADNIRELANRHMAALKRFGEVSPYRAEKPGKGSRGGRPASGMAFNKKQALYLGGKTDLPAGVELLIAMVEVFDAVTSGKALPPPPPPAPALTKADLDAIDQRARAMGEAEERRVRAALTADALDRVRRGQTVDVGALPVSAPTPLLSSPSIHAPPPTGARGGWEALAPGERSLIQNFRNMTPARQEQFTLLMRTAAAYAEALRELWKATAVADMWDSIAEMIESHAQRFRQRIPLG